MGRESLARFWAKTESDPDLQRALEGLFSRIGRSAMATASAIVDLGAAHGFDFTAAELKTHLASTGGHAELSSAELDALAGGVKGAQVNINFKVEIEGVFNGAFVTF